MPEPFTLTVFATIAAHGLFSHGAAHGTATVVAHAAAAKGAAAVAAKGTAAVAGHAAAGHLGTAAVAGHAAAGHLGTRRLGRRDDHSLDARRCHVPQRVQQHAR